MNNWYYLFNDDHEQHLRSESVAVHKLMNIVLDDIDGQMIPGRMLPKFPGICFTVEEKPREKPQPGNWPNRGSNPSPLRDATTLPRDHNGYHRKEWTWESSIQ